MINNNFKISKGKVFNCIIKKIQPIGNGKYFVYFEITNCTELDGKIFSSFVNSNWNLVENINYYKNKNHKFQVEFDGISATNNELKWILHKVG